MILAFSGLKLWKEVSANLPSHWFPGQDGESPGRGHSCGMLLGPTVAAGGCQPVRTFISREVETQVAGVWCLWMLLSVVHSQGLFWGNVVPKEAWSDVHSYFISCRWKGAGGTLAPIKWFVWELEGLHPWEFTLLPLCFLSAFLPLPRCPQPSPSCLIFPLLPSVFPFLVIPGPLFQDLPPPIFIHVRLHLLSGR